MRSIVIFHPLKNGEEERELVISDEQSSTYLILAASLICESDYCDIKRLMYERIGNLLVNCNTKGPSNYLDAAVFSVSSPW